MKTTYTNDDKLECPVCGEEFGDLWEYGDGEECDIVIDCPHCDAPLEFSRHLHASYTARPKALGDTKDGAS